MTPSMACMEGLSHIAEAPIWHRRFGLYGCADIIEPAGIRFMSVAHEQRTGFAHVPFWVADQACHLEVSLAKCGTEDLATGYISIPGSEVKNDNDLWAELDDQARTIISLLSDARLSPRLFPLESRPTATRISCSWRRSAEVRDDFFLEGARTLGCISRSVAKRFAALGLEVELHLARHKPSSWLAKRRARRSGLATGMRRRGRRSRAADGPRRFYTLSLSP